MHLKIRYYFSSYTVVQVKQVRISERENAEWQNIDIARKIFNEYVQIKKAILKALKSAVHVFIYIYIYFHMYMWL